MPHLPDKSAVVLLMLLAAALLPVPSGLFAQTTGSNVVSRATAERIKAPGWWPTKAGPSNDQYVGAKVCAECHSSEFDTAQRTAMAHAMAPAAAAESLRQHSNLTFQVGPYHYKITNKSGKEMLEISKGAASHSSVLLWAFGVGRIAQTYVYEENGAFYESHLSFYTALQGLDVTPGHPHTQPPDLIEGAGRRISSAEKNRCFACHTTASATKNPSDPQDRTPGVTCESCHGPGAAHVAAAKSGDFELAERSIMNPAKLNSVDSVEFCGACHRTWQDVVSDSPTRAGPHNIRFAPYRLENSRCWKEGAEDARITCVTCHDPHQPMAEDPAAYDAKCLQCHLAAGDAKSVAHGGGEHNEREKTDHRTACTIGVKLCVTCHMPKFQSAGFHFTFTDHWIRIAAEGAQLPD